MFGLNNVLEMADSRRTSRPDTMMGWIPTTVRRTSDFLPAPVVLTRNPAVEFTGFVRSVLRPLWRSQRYVKDVAVIEMTRA